MPATTTSPTSAPPTRAGVKRRATPLKPTRRSEQRALKAAVDDERLTADVARPLGGQEAHDVAELLRLAPAAQRDVGQVVLPRPVRIELLETRRRDPSRRDAVDGNAPRAQLARQRLEPAA